MEHRAGQRPSSTQQCATLLRLYYLPLLTGVVALVLFGLWYFDAGRLWLGMLAIGGRAAVTMIGIASPNGIHFAELQALEPGWLLGAPIVAPSGTPDPWFPLASVSTLLLQAFYADIVWTLWRRGSRREALTLAAALTFFVILASISGALMVWGAEHTPITITVFFVPIVAITGVQLSQDLVRSARLSVELAEAGRRLGDSQRKLLLAADAAQAGFWSLDVVSRRLWATPSALRMSGLPEDRPSTLDDLLEVIHPEDRDRVQRALEGEAQASRWIAVDYRIVDAQGRLRWLNSVGSGLDGPESARLLTGMTRDVTERRLAQQTLEQQRQELEHLSRVVTISELSNALVHELNQPLSIILANAEATQTLLDAAQPDWDEIRAIAQDIVDADDRAGQVVERLRQLLRRQATRREPVDLNALVASVLDFLRTDLMHRGVRVQRLLGEHLPRLQAQRVPLEQLLINLIRNACDAVASEPPGRREVEVRTAASADGLVLEVLDRGQGLPEPPERIFEPFHTTRPGRLGLGLPISRSIVRAHGGSLRATPRPGGGACLRALLPLALEETST